MTATHHISQTASKPFKGEFAQACCRCGGTGIYSQYHGVCFRCGGRGQDPTPSREWVFPAAWTEEQVAEFYSKKAEAAHKRAAKKTDARQARMQAACDANPAVAALRASWLAEDGTEESKLWYAVSTVATDIMWKAFQYDLSEKQVALIEQQVEKATAYLAGKATQEAARAAEKANAVLPVGKNVGIRGTVVSRKWHEGQYGSTCKLTVKLEDGACVWFTEPSKAHTAVGDVVACVLGEVVASDKDATFGFGKRPKGFVVVSEAAAEVQS